jgi:hypothetical protein
VRIRDSGRQETQSRTTIKLLPDAEPMDCFILFFNDEHLNNTVTEIKWYGTQKIAEFHLSPLSIWNRWSDESVFEVKAF